MKRYLIALTVAGFIFADTFLLVIPTNNLWARESTRFLVQVSSWSTQETAQKEIERLKKFNLKAQYTIAKDRLNKKWFIIYLDHFSTKKEATQFGNQLIQKGVIKNFKVYPKQGMEASSVQTKKVPFRPSGLFDLQVASLSTESEAQKEVERLKGFNLQAKITTMVDPGHKLWFVVYLDSYKTKEEALAHGSQLGQKNIIHSYRAFPQQREDIPKVEAAHPPAATPSKKEPKLVREESSFNFGPIALKEEENALRITTYLDQKIFPKITTEKTAEGSRLVIYFKNIEKYILPMESNKVQSNILLSFSLARKGPDSIFTLLLSSAYNYQVDQDFYEKDKLYSLVIGREPAAEPVPAIK